METEQAGERYRKERVGTVVSNKMQKTIVVQVTRSTQHPIYKKVIRKIEKYKAHDEKGVAKPGDVVLIRETKPLSKTKRWRLVEVVRS